MNQKKKKIYADLDEVAMNLRVDYGFVDDCVDVYKLAEYLGMKLIPYSTITEKQWAVIADIDIKDGFTVIRKFNGERK